MRPARKLVVGQLSDASRVTSEGRGETEPVADNKTPEGRKRNRRIELIVMKPAEGAGDTDQQGTTTTQQGTTTQ